MVDHKVICPKVYYKIFLLLTAHKGIQNEDGTEFHWDYKLAPSGCLQSSPESSLLHQRQFFLPQRSYQQKFHKTSNYRYVNHTLQNRIEDGKRNL